MKGRDVYTSILSSAGIGFSVQDLNQIINMVLLILSVVNILIILFFRIKDHIKNKEYDKIPNDISQAQKDLENLKGDKKDGTN